MLTDWVTTRSPEEHVLDVHHITFIYLANAFLVSSYSTGMVYIFH